jgi:hypothetical protein
MKTKQIVIGRTTLAYLQNLVDVGEFSQRLIDEGRVPDDPIAYDRHRRAAARMRNLYAAFESDEINPLVG